MNITKIIRGALLCASVVSLSQAANAETVLLHEDFNDDFSTNFPHFFDGDGAMPNTKISAYFLSPEYGYYMPWWVLKESPSDPDRFMGSHSYYVEEDITSDDWLISRPITIPTEGFVLEFDAQSVVIRTSGDRLSDLRVYITDQMVTEYWHPDAFDAEWQQVPAGATPDVTTDEWTHYTMSLDKWAGQTVYINFVNQNTNRDILCIDNVKVYRNDPIELYVEALPQYMAEDKAVINADLAVISGQLKNWTIKFTDGTEIVTESGTLLEEGSTTHFEAEFSLVKDAANNFLIEVTADGIEPVYGSASTTALAFATTRRVLIEETTGLWCGNCPLGMFTIENLVEDENFGDRVLPISVHTTGNGKDMLANDDYADFLGLANIAPMARLNRGSDAIGFSGGHDSKYDPTNMQSFAGRVSQELDKPAIFDVDVDAEWVIEGKDTTAVNVVATVKPALTMTGVKYKVGFALTENNVWLEDHPYWRQTNYFSGYPYESKLGGWTELPEMVTNVRFHFVPRAVPEYTGLANTLPTDLEAGKEYTYEYTIAVPDTYQESKAGCTAPAVNRQFCEVTAYVANGDDLSIANCARVAMSENAKKLFKVDTLAGIESVVVDAAPADDTLYDLMGRRVGECPTPGIYVRNGKKILIR